MDLRFLRLRLPFLPTKNFVINESKQQNKLNKLTKGTNNVELCFYKTKILLSRCRILNTFKHILFATNEIN